MSRRGGVLNISEMPEELLVMILCRLPIRDAVATSSLSKRWQPLWSKLNKLNFDGTETLNKMKIARNKRRNMYPTELSKFMNQVNSVIHKYNQPILQENGDHTPRIIEDFRFCFCLSRLNHGLIDEWLQFALSKKLKVLELGLIDSVTYEFPLGLLQRNLLMMVDLKELILRNVKFRDEFLEVVLTNCSHLEKIVIHDSPLLMHIRVDEQVRNLQHIEIRRCCYLETIYLSDFDLHSFTYEGKEIDLRLTNLPILKEIDMGEQEHVGLNINNNVFNQISSCSSSLHSFSFKIYRPQEKSKLNSLPELPNIRKLRLNISGLKVNCLLKLASIVNACPNLETLTIQLLPSSPFKNKKAKRVAIHPLEHLKLIQILCYSAQITDFEIVARVIENCVRLKKIVVDPRLQSSKDVNATSTSTFISNREDDARSSAREYFGSLTPSGAELAVL